MNLLLEKGAHIVKILMAIISVLLLMSSCAGNDSNSEVVDPIDNNPITDGAPVPFTVIGDVPYSDQQRSGLLQLIDKHNKINPSNFLVHVGDIKSGSVSCEEPGYKDVDSILRLFKVPTFIVLGDNEYNDCNTPEQGLEYWEKYFLHFNENWTFEPTVSYQSERIENFSWVMDKVLFIGINLVGSHIHDATEWQIRLTDNGNWVKEQMEEQKDKVTAAVIFGHANIVEIEPEKYKVFSDLFRTASKAFEKPVLFVHGDGHYWIQNKPWPENNISRLQIDGGSKAVKITVDTSLESPFLFDRNFLD